MNKEMEELKQLRSRLEIDEYALEKECRDQPCLYAEIGELYVVAKGGARTAKENVDFVRAALDGMIRSDPGKYGLQKVTEGAISSAILLTEEYRSAQVDYLSKQEVSDAFQILLSSAEQRKSMLRDLASLYIYNYYSNTGPNRSVTELNKLGEDKYMRGKELKREREHERTGERISGRDQKDF
ncbi:MAG: hypothetical protein ACTSUP_03335 [Candidatus Heimdallarchaeaceae archaeon]